MEFLQNIFTGIKNWFTGIWNKTERRDRMRFLVISGIAVTLLVAALVMLNSSRYQTIVDEGDTLMLRSYSDLLKENGISSRVSGKTLQVDKANAPAALTVLTQSSSAGVELDYSLYQSAMGLTSTDADRRMMSRYQTQQDLKAYLQAFSNVEQANVLIDIPENKGLFTPELKDTTAAVTLVLKNPDDFTSEQAETATMFIANAINTAPENVIITNQNLRRLNGKNSESGSGIMQENYEFQKMWESDLSNPVNRQLSLLYGIGHADATIHLELDFDDVTSQSTTYKPVVGDEEGIVVSQQIASEYAKGQGWYNGEPGTDENGLGDDYPEVDGDLANEFQQEQNTINYLISQLDEQVKRAKGAIKNLTASVLIDTNGLEDTDQNTTAVQALVGAALGLSPSQYATNVVVNYMPMKGVAMAAEDEAAYKAEMDRLRMFEFIQTLVLYVVIGVCAIMLIWRTFALIKPAPIEIPQDFLTGDIVDYKDMVDAATQSMELEVTKTPTRERVEEFIDANPEAVAAMLRAWLQEEPERKW